MGGDDGGEGEEADGDGVKRGEGGGGGEHSGEELNEGVVHSIRNLGLGRFVDA